MPVFLLLAALALGGSTASQPRVRPAELLANPRRLRSMSNKGRLLGRPDAAYAVADRSLALLATAGARTAPAGSAN